MSTFQPFSPWLTPVSTSSSTTDSGGSAVTPPVASSLWTRSLVGTKENKVEGGPSGKEGSTKNVREEDDGGWVERYQSWASNGMSTPGTFDHKEDRQPLGGINTNISPTSISTLSLASPFLPSDPNGVWGPPKPARSQVDREISLAEKLAIAERKIRELTLENEHLRQYRIVPRVSPPFTSLPLPDHQNVLFGSQKGPLSAIDSSNGESAALGASSTTRVPTQDYIPPSHIIASVLHGTFNFADMPPEYLRPIIWVIAHCQPRNNAESAGLKSAVNALATRFSLPRDSDSAIILINSILEWAKNLCFTSCGNYLCQQLLERGEVEDKLVFIEKIKEDLVAIASDKFGTHVLCKAIAVDELEEPILSALLEHGIFESLKTGARRLWREFLEKRRQAQNLGIFEVINSDMQGRWAELACVNEHGSIAVQQVFEVFGNSELMQPCFQEILADIPKVANNQFGHFVITKLISYPPLYRATCDAILSAYPPVATTHHGVNFSKIALTEGGRASIVKYLDAICSQDNGRTPGIVAIATSSIGKAHLTFVLSCLTPSEHVRIRQVCRAYSTTLRNSQSGNDLLRSLGLIHAVGSRHRSGA